MKLEKIKKEVKKYVSKKRFKHIEGVVEKARELAIKYNADVQKCELSALLHDIAKELPLDYLQKISKEHFSSELNEEDMLNSEILHGFVGSYIAEKEFKIKDKEILDGIKYHTIGKKGLGLVARIVYIADAIEKNRTYPRVQAIRSEVDKDLNNGIIFEIEGKLEYLNSIGANINKNTLEMRDWLLETAKKEVK